MKIFLLEIATFGRESYLSSKGKGGLNTKMIQDEHESRIIHISENMKFGLRRTNILVGHTVEGVKDIFDQIDSALSLSPRSTTSFAKRL